MQPAIMISQIYNPQNQTEEELLKSFVVREKEFGIIFDDIKNSQMEHPEPHYIIQGQRGQGKTTLLLKLYYEIKRHEKLSTFVIPVIFNEEQYQINSLFELWSHTAEELEEEEPGFYGLLDAIDEVYDGATPEMSAFKLLRESLRKEKKKLILLVDNIGHMLDKFTRKEQQRLREVLLTCAEIRVIGASAVVLEHTYDYSKPFYELFHVISLEGLSPKETETLLLKLGEHYKQENIEKIVRRERGRMETLRRLSGGVPRTMVLLFEIFVEHEHGNAFHDLEYILDRVTPLYKHRMDDLTPPQQKIVNVIALNWDAITTKDIATKTRLESKVVSAYLKKLEKNGIVRKVKTTTKNYLYYITERFFNIWYLMRYGRRRGKNRVLWLVHFLEDWCNEAELTERTRKHIHALSKGRLYPKHALYFTEALAGTRIEEELQHQLITHTRHYLELKDKTLAAQLSQSDRELLERAEEYYEKDEYKKSLACLEAIQNKDGKVFNYIGSIYIEFENFKKVEKYLLMAAEEGHLGALLQLGMTYCYKTVNYRKAEKYFLLAVQGEVTFASLFLGIIYQYALKEIERAEKYYLMALEEKKPVAMNDWRRVTPRRIKNSKEYEKELLKAWEAIRLIAMRNLGILYSNEIKDINKAEKYYLMAVEKGDSEALRGLGILYHDELKDYKKAEKYYLMAAEKGDLEAIIRLGALYHIELKEYKKAEKCYLLAVEEGNSGVMLALGRLYDDELKDIQKAEKYYLMAAETGKTEAIIALAVFYFYQKENKEKVLELVRKVSMEEAHDKFGELRNKHNLSMALLWNNKIEESLEIMFELMELEEYLEEFDDVIREYLIHLMAKKQFYAALKIFEQNRFDLKERVSPIYYALMNFLKDDFPNEYRKMGEELQQTVEEVIQMVKQWEKDYA